MNTEGDSLYENQLFLSSHPLSFPSLFHYHLAKDDQRKIFEMVIGIPVA